jgi:DNA-binding transcriptional LysR family regulator
MLRTMNVDYIKKLWTLNLVVQLGSLKKAAVTAKVSASAVSQAVSSLEKACGKPLLVRSRGTAVPTPEALSLLKRVRPAFAVFEQLDGATISVDAPAMTNLNFGTYESIALDVLPRLFAKVHQQLPNTRLCVRISRTGNLLSMVRKGELYTALVTETDNVDRLLVEAVGTDEMGFYVARDLPIGKMAWDAITHVGVGTLAPGRDGYPRYMARFLKQLGLVKPFMRSDSFEVLSAVASAGFLVATLPNRVAKRNPDLMEIFPPGRKSWDGLGLHSRNLVGLMGCDREEFDFLAREIRKILG